MKKCEECNGTGEIVHIEDPENGVMNEYYYECNECKGTGEIIKVSLYESITNVIDQIIQLHKGNEVEMTERDKHYYIQGLEVAKQQIEQLDDWHTTELAYETFEDTVKALKGNLERYDMEVIIEDIFMDDDSEDDE